MRGCTSTWTCSFTASGFGRASPPRSAATFSKASWTGRSDAVSADFAGPVDEDAGSGEGAGPEDAGRSEPVADGVDGLRQPLLSFPLSEQVHLHHPVGGQVAQGDSDQADGPVIPVAPEEDHRRFKHLPADVRGFGKGEGAVDGTKIEAPEGEGDRPARIAGFAGPGGHFLRQFAQDGPKVALPRVIPRQGELMTDGPVFIQAAGIDRTGIDAPGRAVQNPADDAEALLEPGGIRLGQISDGADAHSLQVSGDSRTDAEQPDDRKGPQPLGD